MSIAEIHQLPLSEKLQIMEAIWEDLRSQADALPVPDWHKNLLDARLKAVEEGRESVLDWDEVKHSLLSGTRK
jgi:putative addiction module component (TIGR02574 family)